MLFQQFVATTKKKEDKITENFNLWYFVEKELIKLLLYKAYSKIRSKNQNRRRFENRFVSN